MTNLAPESWRRVMAELDTLSDKQSGVESVIDALIPQMSDFKWIVADAILKCGGMSNDVAVDYFRKLANRTDTTLYNWVNTAQTFTPDMRWQLIADYPHLEFSHFRELPKTVKEHGLDAAVDVLKLAGSEQWTIPELKRHIAVEINGEDETGKLLQVAKTTGIFESTPEYHNASEFGNVIHVPNDLVLEHGKEYIIKVYEVQNDA